MPGALLIVLLIWIVVIPTTVVLVMALVAHRRRAELRVGRAGTRDQAGQLLRFEEHVRRLEHARTPRAAHPSPLPVRQRQQLRNRAG